MSDSRLQRKVEETVAAADRQGIHLQGPMLAVFELPSWGAGVASHEVEELARMPGTGVAASMAEPLNAARAVVEGAPRLHVIAERGLVCALSGGAILHAYPSSVQEMTSFAVALFAGAAPAGLRLALLGHVSSGRQEIWIQPGESAPPGSSKELLHAIRRRNGIGVLSTDEAVLVDDMPSTLEAVRQALALDLPRRAYRVSRMVGGRFRFSPESQGRVIAGEELLPLVQGIAISCDRFLETRGEMVFGFATEPVARWRYGVEQGARTMAQELFGAPDTAITHLGLHPFTGEGTLFFAYEGSEAVLEAQNKGIAFVRVRDLVEYARVLQTIRRGV
ncbi:MAG: hypothetical protein ACT4PV_02825 [Planctomycetaceae bacterium]